jgi:hypothetical protein
MTASTFRPLSVAKRMASGILAASRAQPHVLLGPRVDGHFDLAARQVFLQLSDDAIVLELLTNRPHQDRAQRRPPRLRKNKSHNIHERPRSSARRPSLPTVRP